MYITNLYIHEYTLHLSRLRSVLDSNTARKRIKQKVQMTQTGSVYDSNTKTYILIPYFCLTFC